MSLDDRNTVCGVFLGGGYVVVGRGGEDLYPQLRPRVSAIYLFGIGYLWSV